MSFERIVALAILIFVFILLGFILYKTAPKRTRKSTFKTKWKDIYKFCAHKETWPTALIMADELLDLALKRRRFKGKNMGERLVAAQKIFEDNDSLWYAHKLSAKVKDHPKSRLKEKDVKEALASFQRGLKELGVL